MDENKSFRIIIIDDNAAIHQDFIKILTNKVSLDLNKLSFKMFGKQTDEITLPTFEIDTASQGQEGVEYVKRADQLGYPYSLAFVDIRMPPGWDGIETIKHIWEIDKNIQVVICTAYSDYTWEETVSNLGKTDNLLVLKKPFDNVSVRQLACALTKKWQLSKEARDYTKTLKQEVEDKTLSLKKSISLIKSTFESSSDGILVVNNAGNIIDYNQRLVDMFQIPKAMFEAKKITLFFDFLKEKLVADMIPFIKIFDLKLNVDNVTIDMMKFSDGRYFECYAQPHKLNEQIVGRIFDFRDITKRAQLEEELQQQAAHDALTGLANRITLREKMQFAIKTADQTKTKFAVLFLDLDRFKLVNDSLGHEAGDLLLQAAAERLKKVVSSEDTLARLGGDEFVIILMNFQEDHVFSKIQKLLNDFQAPFIIGNREVTVTTSIGISIYPTDGNSPTILLRNADAAMYQAKAKKGNKFEVFSSEMNEHSLAVLDQEIALRKAITNNEFFLCYQPQLDLTNEKIMAVEALIRWQHPKKGVLLPIDFIPLAEETGLIAPLGEWVLQTACEQNKAWQDAGLPPIRVAINVTGQQLKIQNTVNVVKKALKTTGLKPEYLELELTENVILSNMEAVNIITGLKNLGINITVDDFGTGYTSLSYLHKIPLNRLKIDRSFIQHIKSNKDDEVIIRAVIAMAKNLNLEVIAEGVETIDQLNFLKENRCKDIQGFYYSKPLLPSEVEKFLRNPSQIKSTNLHSTE